MQWIPALELLHKHRSKRVLGRYADWQTNVQLLSPIGDYCQYCLVKRCVSSTAMAPGSSGVQPIYVWATIGSRCILGNKNEHRSKFGAWLTLSHYWLDLGPSMFSHYLLDIICVPLPRLTLTMPSLHP